jgi:DNA-binding Lrp family transcriptional regulator
MKWAMDDAPMLATGKGRPDTTARHVLQVLAEHARPDGTEAHPSVLRISYRTGYDERTVQRALRRLEDGRLIKRDGAVQGRTRWKLAMHRVRPGSDWDRLEAAAERARESAAERQRRSRANRNPSSVTHSECVTSEPVTHSEGVTDEGVSRTLRPHVTHSASARHALSAPLTTNNHHQPKEGGGGAGAESQRRDASPARRPDGLHPLPEDFALTDAMRRWSLSTFGPALDVDHETAQFISHFRAEGVRKKSWPDAWQKWMRRSAQYASERAQRPNLRAVVGQTPEDRGIF